MASGSSMREIADRLLRATSTVSREVAHHDGRTAYRAYDADQQVWNAVLRPKRCLFTVNSELRDVVASKLILDWSPEQIAGWLKALYPHNESMAGRNKFEKHLGGGDECEYQGAWAGA
jgi:IS30 family transposase